jgi:hypothetical protein
MSIHQFQVYIWYNYISIRKVNYITTGKSISVEISIAKKPSNFNQYINIIKKI